MVLFYALITFELLHEGILYSPRNPQLMHHKKIFQKFSVPMDTSSIHLDENKGHKYVNFIFVFVDSSMPFCMGHFFLLLERSNTMNNNLITAILVQPGTLAKPIETATDLDSLQHIVGGPIELIYLEQSVVLLCNGESKRNGLRPNRLLKEDFSGYAGVVFGTFLIVGCNSNTGTLENLPIEKADYYLNRYHYPELLLCLNDSFTAVHYNPAI